MSWKDTILEAFDVFGPASLFLLSFTEAIQPIPPDLLYIPMLVNAMGTSRWSFGCGSRSPSPRCWAHAIAYWLGQLGYDTHEAFGQEKHLQLNT